jgi:hypothetical protein
MTKKRLAGALEKAKEIRQTKKRRKTEGEFPTEDLPVAGPEDSDLSAIPDPLPSLPYMQQVSLPLRLPFNSGLSGNIHISDCLEPSIH